MTEDNTLENGFYEQTKQMSEKKGPKPGVYDRIKSTDCKNRCGCRHNSLNYNIHCDGVIISILL